MGRASPDVGGTIPRARDPGENKMERKPGGGARL